MGAAGAAVASARWGAFARAGAVVDEIDGGAWVVVTAGATGMAATAATEGAAVAAIGVAAAVVCAGWP
jgi:hypothetical protein